MVLRDGHVVHADGPWLVGLDEAGSIVADASFEAGDVFDELNAAHTVEPVVVDVPAGTDVEAPIVVLHEITHDGAAVFPRLIVRVGANASVNVVDIVRSGDIRALFVPVTEFRVADAARAGYASVQELGPRVWQVGSQTSEVGAQATYSSGCIAFGGDYARTRVSCRLVGRGSTGNLGAAYFGDGDQVLDFRTFQDHLAADTTSNLLFKGVLDDASRSIYSGLIRVSEDARGTNAFQTNRNIKLSDKAWAESVPNLEIETNDVRCSHASTVGPIDEEQRFYLESRGVPTAEAERLIIAGFFEEVLDALPVSSLADGLRARIAEKLDDNAGEDAQ